ncbi:hypothetical protein DXG01_004721 [Tephrocybe rancida]|nr:hypothetical protein DXG01_004721 [Tephrocybe rancida]
MDTLSVDPVLHILTFLALTEVDHCRFVNRSLNATATLHLQSRLSSLLSVFFDSSLHHSFWQALEIDCAGLTGEIVESFVLGAEAPLMQSLHIVAKYGITNIITFIGTHLPGFVEVPPPSPIQHIPCVRKFYTKLHNTDLLIEIEDPCWAQRDFFNVVYATNRPFPGLLTHNALLNLRRTPRPFPDVPEYTRQVWYCNALCEFTQTEFDFHRVDTQFFRWGGLDSIYDWDDPLALHEDAFDNKCFEQQQSGCSYWKCPRAPDHLPWVTCGTIAVQTMDMESAEE